MVTLRVGKHTIFLDDEDLNRVRFLSMTLTGQSRGVLSATIEGRTRSLARFILNYNGPLEVDHKDHNKFNFQKTNLRPATRQQQMANSKPQLNRKYKGISQHSNRSFRASLKFNQKQVHIGYFDTEEQAAKAYDKKAKQLFGEFALLNFKEIL